MNYSILITEDLSVLQVIDKQQTNAQYRDYIRFLRLLKEEAAPTQLAAVRQVNLGLRQAQRVWKQYREQGLEELIEPRQSTYTGKLSTTQMSHLRQFCSMTGHRPWLISRLIYGIDWPLSTQ